MTNERIWTLCKIAVVILIILTFTPLVTPSGIHKPAFMGLPYTLWVGILEAFLLVGITWLATIVHSGRHEE